MSLGRSYRNDSLIRKESELRPTLEGRREERELTSTPCSVPLAVDHLRVEEHRREQ